MAKLAPRLDVYAAAPGVRFLLQANSTYDLVIVPAIPKLQNWAVTITCDNGTKTETSTFF